MDSIYIYIHAEIFETKRYVPIIFPPNTLSNPRKNPITGVSCGSSLAATEKAILQGAAMAQAEERPGSGKGGDDMVIDRYTI